MATQQMASSDFNLKKLTTKQLSEHVSSSIKIGSNIAIFGRRGSGKTAVAKELNISPKSSTLSGMMLCTLNHISTSLNGSGLDIQL